ncbi:flavanone 3-dioxygenase 2-like [Andrographis paniculata]|uniref:flavanone 3-dioxygenase 2-like n=1 Tax=Andrographis paniculata TaxID=175694 RepID=UPI0021E886FE|nr:flavanone 3-dioxygenase 2-like [Andrographis paniculata]
MIMNPNQNDHTTLIPSASEFKSESECEDDNKYQKGVKHLLDSTPERKMKKLPREFVLPLPPRPTATADLDIPLVDLAGLTQPHSRISAVEAISSACATWGFFRIVNHGIEVGMMSEMMKAVEEFFDLSVEEKMKYASDDVMSPVRFGTSLNTSKKHSRHWRDFLRHYGHPLHISPQNPPNYRIVSKEYLERLWELAGGLAGAISEGLGLPAGYIEDTLIGDGLQIIAANYYPPCPEPDKALGLAAHSDHGAITILMDNGVEGLEVKHDGAWIPVPHAPGTFVVNVGDCLEVLTNGKYRSVEHRATVNAERTRISVAVARGPNLSTWIRPAEALAECGAGCRYRPTLYSEYLRLQQSSTTRGKTALHAISM